VKRGLIAWDREQLAASTFDARLQRACAVLDERDLPALVVYSDVWRSNHARFLTNFMPYWNRSLVVIPREGEPVLLCGLSPRVYPWIRSVTVFEEIRPASKLAQSLVQFCEERGWKKIGVLDLPALPNELASRLGGLGLEDVASRGIVGVDDGELAMRRHAVKMARMILQRHLDQGEYTLDYEFAGGLERAYRRAGAEDVVILLSSNGRAPRPANGSMLTGRFSVVVALEYCGHWVKIARAYGSENLRERFEAALKAGDGRIENLAGPRPWEIGRGEIFALTVEHDGVYYGDTCWGDRLL
jgi:hypothetical protein